MDFRKAFMQLPSSSVVTVALLLTLSGFFFYQGDLLGKATPTELVPVETVVTEAPPPPAIPRHELTPEQIEGALLAPKHVPQVPAVYLDEETLWLARCVYSETKRPEEQELVAWVVRNRVDTRYRGKGTYQEVVLDPYQFSVFNPESPLKDYYVGLNVDSNDPGWQNTLSLVYYVRHAPARFRPFSIKTRHFYSEWALLDTETPSWIEGMIPIEPARPHLVEAHRFRFYADII